MSIERELRGNWDTVNYPEPEPVIEQQMAPGQLPGDVLVAEAGGGGAAFGVYPGMGKRSQKSNIGEKMITGAPDFAAGGLRGIATSAGGFGGDVQKIGRFIGALATDNQGGSFQDKLQRAAITMEDPTFLPSSEDLSKTGYTIPGTNFTIPPFSPAVPPGTTAFGMTPEERQQAAELGQNVGELVGDPVMLAKGGQMAVKGAVKAAETLAPKAGEMVIKSMDKLGTPVMMNAVPPGPSAAGAATKAMAPASDIGFYSAVEKAALNVQRNSGSGQAFLNDITKGENVKLDEIKWMGLDDFLKGKKNVTKQEVQDFVKNNRVDVKEVTLGGTEPYDAQRLSQLESEYKALKQHPIDDPSFGENKYDEMIKLMNIRDQSTVSSLYDAAENAMRSAQRAQQQGNKLTAEKYWKENELLNTRAEKLDLQGQGMSNPPKFGDYTLPGGNNYREILLTLPPKQKGTSQISFKTSKDVENFLTDMSMTGYEKLDYGRINDGNVVEFGGPIPGNIMQVIRNNDGDIVTGKNYAGSTYGSPHFGEQNILAHLRVNDRVDADGKKMLLIEEVQSDWHQAGREKGYRKQGQPERLKGEAYQLPDGTYGVKWEDGSVANLGWGKANAERLANEGKFTSDVPDAPFKDTWYQLALKRALRYAADNGYDRVGITTGKQQAERYDLSKQVDELLYKKNDDGTYQVSAQVQGRGNLLGKEISENKLSDFVGKEVANKIIENSGRDVNLGANNQPKDIWKGLSGIDLKVGGEGMKKYYDDIYPKFLEKYGKKWGASVGETQIKTGNRVPGGEEPVRYIDITPEMRKSVQKGQPLAAVSSESTVA